MNIEFEIRKSLRFISLNIMLGLKVKVSASAYFTKLGRRHGCVFCGWGVFVRGWVYRAYVYMSWGCWDVC